MQTSNEQTRYHIKYPNEKTNYNSERNICYHCRRLGYGNYCPYCGSKYKIERLSFKYLLNRMICHLIGDGFYTQRKTIIHYGVLLTLWRNLFHPVVTSTEYIKGKRRKYFDPISLLVLMSTLNALIIYFCKKTGTPYFHLHFNPTYFLDVTEKYNRFSENYPLVTWALLGFAYALSNRRVYKFIRFTEHLYLQIFILINILTFWFFINLFNQFFNYFDIYNIVTIASYIYLISSNICIYANLYNFKRKKLIWDSILDFLDTTLIVGFLYAIICVVIRFLDKIENIFQ